MENRSVSQNRSRDTQASARDSHVRESRRLGYQLKYESPRASHANIRSKMVNDVKTFPPRSSEFLQKQQDCNGKDSRNEEVVRYMSNLPSFLKKDVKINEKGFSVGVLDWKLLEKWQHFHKRSIHHSSASSDLSSFSSTGGSSSQSSAGHSLSPAQKKLPYPTLQSHFNGTPFENCSHDTESSGVNKLKAQDRKAIPSGLAGVQQTALRTHLASDQRAEYKLKDCYVKDPKVAKSSMAKKSESLKDVRENMRIQDPESFRRCHHYTIDELYSRKKDTPTCELGKKYPQARRSLKLTDTKTFGSNKSNHLSFPSSDNFEACCTELSCDIPHSCPLEADPTHLHKEEPCSGASKDNKIAIDLFQRFSDCQDVSVNNSRGKKLQKEKLLPAVEDQVITHSRNPPMSSNTKTGPSETTKVRNPSPTRRFSFSLSRVGKVSGSSSTSTVLQSSARNPTGSSGAEEAGISSSSLNSLKANCKGRSSSPLRRLLDPLMGPARASLSDSRSSERACKSSEGHRDSTSHSVKVKLDLGTCKNGDAEVPHCSSKSANTQALLQVAVRNGFPLFTFAVDNKNDILAATMRKSGSFKEEFSYIYSFFIVQEMKKKSGSWINHGRKDKCDSFVPNIVAQMKVNDAVRQNSVDQSILKEYVLFSHDTKQAEISEQNDELAAIVVKILKKSSSHWCQNLQGYENSDDSPASKFKQTYPLSSFKCNSGSGNMGENQTEDQLSMTVLLPGGHHGQPIKGEPSSLVKRWQSGGSCDCGGWDLGCRMRVLTDNAQFRQKSSSAKPHHSPKLLELFSQDGQDQKPVFSLARFKDGIYAVEFNSSIKILQAFSISLSILSCLKPVEFVETSNGLKEKSSADFSVSVSGGEKVYSKTQTEVPAFVSNPPLSPVGRV